MKHQSKSELQQLREWHDMVFEVLHLIGVELGLREGFDYDEILPAIRDLMAANRPVDGSSSS